jgi:acyl-coenzyme A thioesterase PaaI-like protein
MPGRSDNESKLEAKFRAKLDKYLADFGSVAEELRRKAPLLSPTLSTVLEELSVLTRHPRALGARLETQSAWLNRLFLSAASNLAEPFLLGMGLRVESLGEESVEAVLPGGWRNQSEGGLLHTGALSTVGEFTSRIYWEHHLDLSRSELQVKSLNLRVHGSPRGDVRAIFRMSVGEREAVLHRLRTDGRTQVDSHSSLYDSEGRLLAEVEIVWQLERRLALGVGESSGHSS